MHLLIFYRNFLVAVDSFCLSTNDAHVNGTCDVSKNTGYCEIEVHINTSTKQPLYVEKDCVYFHGFPTQCNPSFINVHDDLLESCCSEPAGCNRCPTQALIDKVNIQYRDEVYDLFPDECRTSSVISVPVSPSHTLLPPSTILVSPVSSTSSSLVPSPTSTINTPPLVPTTSNSTQVFVITIGVVVVVLFICICSLFILGFFTCYTVTGRRRRIVRANDAPPFCSNAAFNELTETGLSCSSNALTESRLLQSRTISHDVTLSTLIGKGRFGQVYVGELCYPATIKLYYSCLIYIRTNGSTSSDCCKDLREPSRFTMGKGNSYISDANDEQSLYSKIYILR